MSSTTGFWLKRTIGVASFPPNVLDRGIVRRKVRWTIQLSIDRASRARSHPISSSLVWVVELDLRLLQLAYIWRLGNLDAYVVVRVERTWKEKHSIGRLARLSPLLYLLRMGISVWIFAIAAFRSPFSTRFRISSCSAGETSPQRVASYLWLPSPRSSVLAGWYINRKLNRAKFPRKQDGTLEIFLQQRCIKYSISTRTRLTRIFRCGCMLGAGPRLRVFAHQRRDGDGTRNWLCTLVFMPPSVTQSNSAICRERDVSATSQISDTQYFLRQVDAKCTGCRTFCSV
ncbi:hypothetical protein BJV77DRAFT_960895 [Russula vinacea]|nr:hypothetical protein BJV77DRAFT_960895 [Russula vinacea]